MASVQVDRLQKKRETRPVFLPWQQLLGKRVGDTRPQRRAAGTFSSRRKRSRPEQKVAPHRPNCRNSRRPPAEQLSVTRQRGLSSRTSEAPLRPAAPQPRALRHHFVWRRPADFSQDRFQPAKELSLSPTPRAAAAAGPRPGGRRRPHYAPPPIPFLAPGPPRVQRGRGIPAAWGGEQLRTVRRRCCEQRPARVGRGGSRPGPLSSACGASLPLRRWLTWSRSLPDSSVLRRPRWDTPPPCGRTRKRRSRRRLCRVADGAERGGRHEDGVTWAEAGLPALTSSPRQMCSSTVTEAGLLLPPPRSQSHNRFQKRGLLPLVLTR